MKLSNLDQNDKLVKRGQIVSHHGLRYQVQRVLSGKFWGGRLDAFGKLTGQFDWLVCENVQIVEDKNKNKYHRKQKI